MAEEAFAVSTIAPAPAAQSDYDSICTALMQTERGRWFLEEYAKRNRSADTQILLTAIQRIETVVCADRDERSKQAQQGFRTDLLEMAKAITRTRAEVAGIPTHSALHPEAAGLGGEAAPPPRSRDVFAAAERIREVTWAMRGHGFDPSTCDQLEELAAAILSASALRDPGDRRASKLSEVLQYLEQRIETLLVGSHDGEASEAAPESPSLADLSAPAAAAEPAIEFPATTTAEFVATDLAADIPAPEFHHAPSSRNDLEGEADVPPHPAVEIAPPEPSAIEPDAVEATAEPGESVAAIGADVPAADAEARLPPLQADAGDSTAAISDEVPRLAAELATQSEPTADEDVEPVAALIGQAPATPDLADVSDPPVTGAEPEPAAGEAFENPGEDSISARIQEVSAPTADLTLASEPDATADGTEPAPVWGDLAPADALTAPDLSLDQIFELTESVGEPIPASEMPISERPIEPGPSPTEADSAADGVGPALSADPATADALAAADPSLEQVIEADAPAAAVALVPESDLPATDAGPEPAPTDGGIQEAQAQAAEPAPPSGQSARDEVESSSAFSDETPTNALATDGEPAAASSPAPAAEAAPDTEAAPDDAPEAASGSAAPPAALEDPDAQPADPETRLPAVDLIYATPWLPGSSGLQSAAAVLLAATAFLPEMHMRAAMPGIATAQAAEALQAIAVSPETAAVETAAVESAAVESAAVAPAPERRIVIDLDEADWAAFGPPEPPPSPAAPQPEAAKDMPARQIEMPKPAPAAELPSAPALAAAPAQTAGTPQPLNGDPLAALKVMSPEELIALFS